jgi:hypothetical protein
VSLIFRARPSHHLEKLKHEDLSKVRREGTYLWYSANADTLEELLGFLYAECCTRNKAIAPQKIVCCNNERTRTWQRRQCKKLFAKIWPGGAALRRAG